MASPPPVGLKIKRARERLRITQVQLGEAVGVSQKTIDNWEHDKRYPRSSIGALEQILGISLTEPDGFRAGTPALRTEASQMSDEEREEVMRQMLRLTRRLADDDALRRERSQPEDKPPERKAANA